MAAGTIAEAANNHRLCFIGTPLSSLVPIRARLPEKV